MADSSSIQVQEVLQCGLLNHQAGRLVQASVSYSEVLRIDPNNADAWCLSGVVARQEGRLDASEQLIGQAILIRATVATYHHNLGRTYALQGRTALAAESYRMAIGLNAADFGSMRMLGNLLGETGDLPGAIALYEKVLELCPGEPEVYYSLGFLWKRREDMETALGYYRKATVLFPDASDSHFNLAKALYEAGQPGECVACYQRVLALQPEDAETHNCLGRLFHESGDLGLARDSYLRAVTLRPDFAEALSNLGALQMDAGELETAAAVLRRSISLKPDLLNAYCNLGSVLTKQGDALGAIEAFRTVLMVDPNNVSTLCNLGCTLDALGDNEGAESCFRMALEVDPLNSLARFNLSSHILLAGSFAEGWREYEQRWEVRQFAGKREPFVQPQWRGEPIFDATIYVYAEQGLGDTLQFARYVPLVAELGAKVVFEVQPLLYTLLKNIHPAVRVVVGKAGRPSDVDWHCPLLSLPAAFGTDMSNIPVAVPYVHAEAGKSAAWSRRLGRGRMRVGLVWRGNPGHTRDRLRSIPIEQFGQLTRVEGPQFYSLQKGLTDLQWSQVEASTRDVVDLSEELKDFTDTAAIIANMDLIITVDTSVAHLVGAMGKPVWILVPHAPDWRWLKERTDSPWYPAARLFRQTAAGQWGDVLERVEQRLEQMQARSFSEST